jgi:C1A family cysteine protease
MSRNQVINPRYSWVRDLPDPRDVAYKSLHAVPQQIDPNLYIDLSPLMPPVWDQNYEWSIEGGKLTQTGTDGQGACTQFASTAALLYAEKKVNPNSQWFYPAWDFGYYNMRVKLEKGSAADDAGGEIRDAVKSLATWGMCDLYLWPYDDEHFSEEPDAAAYIAATKHKAESYISLARDMFEFAHCLSSGSPIIAGITLPESFEDSTPTTGILELPKKGEKIVGGHAILIVGIDWKNKRLLIRNSWGLDFGIAPRLGYFWAPIEYFTNENLSDDFWKLTRAS